MGEIPSRGMVFDTTVDTDVLAYTGGGGVANASFHTTRGFIPLLGAGVIIDRKCVVQPFFIGTGIYRILHRVLSIGQRHLHYPFVSLCFGRLSSSFESDEMAVKMGCVSFDRILYVYCTGRFFMDVGDGANRLFHPGDVADKRRTVCLCRCIVVFCIATTSLLVSVSTISLSRVCICCMGRIPSLQRKQQRLA